ncbi:hypothetical protein COU78_01400 [Candidatus Peregrinibacteria bacterium CG10_big_fil_rev_8_21_14_0_10_49_24]|nr:MAG: hypothetical protein COV83_04365 [Candidatus Peregrinibacteria bacterium CG11_big_fil_rev_8_21_14_0_20_49_14]PIR51381.1 MAG: hypothetical protein COU78_01400 [Candidatus Peregrinibacteria bacterium CG10_big_fil_rev_8_21_14_0_10_49_24]PJA68145.1 MAG: hypothetical protein CO157_01215 [Candidatus Peregrinibacteria bacterium CG_4_9_14_3_um_filter_49_12]
MNEDEVRKKCEAFVQGLGLPCFIVFGWEKESNQFGMVSSYNKMPVQAVIKGMSWALNDIVSKSM